MAMKEELNILIQAQYPLIYLVTSEEERAEQAISLRSTQRRIYICLTVTHGIVEYGGDRVIIRQRAESFLSLKICTHLSRSNNTVVARYL